MDDSSNSFDKKITKILKLLPFLISGFLCVFITDIAKASRIDTIYFQNGDRITGEVKSLENNLLRLSTDDAGTIKLVWNNVDSVFIKNTLRITKQDGEIFYGKLFPSGKEKECAIHEKNGNIRQEKLKQIVELLPADKKFADRFNGTISAGYSYTKASEVSQLDFSGNLHYQTKKNMWEGNYDIVLTNEKGSGTTQHQNGGVIFQRVLPKKWFIQAKLMAESNSEFKLDLRTTLGIGTGNNILYTNSKRLYAAAGLLINKEFSQDLSQNNLEGIILLNYSMYILDSPEVILNFYGDIIPGFNHWGRVRSEIDSNVKWELFNDFYLKWTFFNSFDKKPLSGTTVRSDWGITFGLEYKI